jgi:hypothetical protein
MTTAVATVAIVIFRGNGGKGVRMYTEAGTIKDAVAMRFGVLHTLSITSLPRVIMVSHVHSISVAQKELVTGELRQRR